ncbi:MAG TPA: DUF4032 domain-containing protein [Kiritimatiellia bacterium]|nr:DUF4032 domain-containing protein [Kiritimatiellia bacterium]
MKVNDQQKNDVESKPDDWLQSTRLFQCWNSMKQEILLHKWYQSEKAGYDVGWERAATNWMIHYGRRFDSRDPSRIKPQQS